MTRALLTIRTDADRARAVSWITAAVPGTRIEVKETKRSLPQNDRMWAMLTDVSEQKEHFGVKHPPETWKSIFMKALGKEIDFVPSLDGDEIIPIGYRSSDLGKTEMSDLIELIFAWGAQNGVVFHDPELARLDSLGTKVA